MFPPPLSRLFTNWNLGIVTALVKCADDQTGKVQKSVLDSLFDIGRHEPEEVLTQCNDAIKGEPKVLCLSLPIIPAFRFVFVLPINVASLCLICRLFLCPLIPLGVDLALAPHRPLDRDP